MRAFNQELRGLAGDVQGVLGPSRMEIPLGPEVREGFLRMVGGRKALRMDT